MNRDRVLSFFFLSFHLFFHIEYMEKFIDLFFVRFFFFFQKFESDSYSMFFCIKFLAEKKCGTMICSNR